MKNAPEVYEVSAYAEWVSFPAYVLIFCPDDLRKWAKTLAELIPYKSMYIGGMYPPIAATLLEEDDHIADKLIAFKDPDWLRFGGWEFKVYEDEITLIARPKDGEGEIFCAIPLLDEARIKEAQELANTVDRSLL